MDEQQYRRILSNHCWHEARPAMVQKVASKLLRQLTGKVRRRELGVDAWRRVAEPEWMSVTRVEAVEGDTLVVSVRKASYLGELRRQAGQSGRAVAKLLPGVRRVRFVPAGHDDARGA